MTDKVDLALLREAIDEHEQEEFAKRFRERSIYGSPQQADIYRRYMEKLEAKRKSDKVLVTVFAIAMWCLALYSFYDAWSHA